MKSLKLVCYASVFLSLIPSAYARPVHRRTAHPSARRATHSSARHAAAPGVAAILQRLYNEADAAETRKDLDGALRYYSQDIVLVDPQGNEVDLGDARYRMSALFDAARSIHDTSEVINAAQKGNDATVTVRSVAQIVMIDPKTEKKNFLFERTTARDTWSHTDDGWMIVRSQILSDQSTVNGHSVNAAPGPNGDQNDNNTPQGFGTPDSGGG